VTTPFLVRLTLDSLFLFCCFCVLTSTQSGGGNGDFSQLFGAIRGQQPSGPPPARNPFEESLFTDPQTLAARERMPPSAYGADGPGEDYYEPAPYYDNGVNHHVSRARRPPAPAPGARRHHYPPSMHGEYVPQHGRPYHSYEPEPYSRPRHREDDPRLHPDPPRHPDPPHHRGPPRHREDDPRLHPDPRRHHDPSRHQDPPRHREDNPHLHPDPPCHRGPPRRREDDLRLHPDPRHHPDPPHHRPYGRDCQSNQSDLPVDPTREFESEPISHSRDLLQETHSHHHGDRHFHSDLDSHEGSRYQLEAGPAQSGQQGAYEQYSRLDEHQEQHSEQEGNFFWEETATSHGTTGNHTSSSTARSGTARSGETSAAVREVSPPPDSSQHNGFDALLAAAAKDGSSQE
jgi:hypothetical protein